ncbi:CRP-like cAMP-binding protein [Bradyrhizobium sp. i1.7.7]
MLQLNAILASLPEGDKAALKPHLKAIHLQQKTVLYETGDTISAVYFPTKRSGLTGFDVNDRRND